MARQMKDSGVEWIGRIPDNWSARMLFQIFSEVKNKNEGLIETNLLSLSYGKIKRKDIDSSFGLLPESFEGYNIIEKDDIVLRLTDLQNDQRSLRTGLAGEQGIVTSAYTSLRLRTTEASPNFMHYSLHVFDVCKGFYGMGAGVRQGLNWSGIRKLVIPWCGEEEQRSISGYLDTKCAEIDKVVEQTRATIEEYKKLKQAIITEAVTKGVRGPRPMKPSGVEWIGDIPEEWEFSRVKYVIKNYKAGPFGSSLITANLLSRGDILVYTPEHIAKQTHELEGNLYLPNERQEEMDAFIVDVGDIVFPIVGSLGRAMLISDGMPKGIINQRLAKFRLVNDKIRSDFFLWLFAKSSFYSVYIDINCRGSIIVNLTKEIIKAMPLVLPSLDEQQEIATYLDTKCAEVDRIIEKKEQLIEELGSYKKSLIYEYVTGKKEVTA